MKKLSVRKFSLFVCTAGLLSALSVASQGASYGPIGNLGQEQQVSGKLSILSRATDPFGIGIQGPFKVLVLATSVPVTPSRPSAKPEAVTEASEGPLDNLVIAGWQNNARLVILQNSKTKALQIVTLTPNASHLRIVGASSNPNPALCEVTISDGTDQAIIRFKQYTDVHVDATLRPKSQPRPAVLAQNR